MQHSVNSQTRKNISRKQMSSISVPNKYYREDWVGRFPRNAGISQPNDIPARRHVSLDLNINTTVRN